MQLAASDDVIMLPYADDAALYLLICGIRGPWRECAGFKRYEATIGRLDVCVRIDESRCRGERCCTGVCPANAIRGPFGKPQHIVERLCTRCLACAAACPYGAIIIE